MDLIFGLTFREYAQKIFNITVEIDDTVPVLVNNVELNTLARRIINIDGSKVKIHPNNKDTLLSKVSILLMSMSVNIKEEYDKRLNFMITPIPRTTTIIPTRRTAGSRKSGSKKYKNVKSRTIRNNSPRNTKRKGSD
jgi:hypothetical protein